MGAGTTQELLQGSLEAQDEGHLYGMANGKPRSFRKGCNQGHRLDILDHGHTNEQGLSCQAASLVLGDLSHVVRDVRCLLDSSRGGQDNGEAKWRTNAQRIKCVQERIQHRQKGIVSGYEAVPTLSHGPQDDQCRTLTC